MAEPAKPAKEIVISAVQQLLAQLDLRRVCALLCLLVWRPSARLACEKTHKRYESVQKRKILLRATACSYASLSASREGAEYSPEHHEVSNVSRCVREQLKLCNTMATVCFRAPHLPSLAAATWPASEIFSIFLVETKPSSDPRSFAER